ncbi:MAG: glycosyltransferase [Chloroflexi bacterium]|nr:MAG: glycosyltransferase [Chloroflexota bacterium]
MIEIAGMIYTLTAAWLSLYGLLGLITLALYIRHRRQKDLVPAVPADGWPRVTVQLPVYNEPNVVKRLIETAVSLDYPRHCLEIQIVDDSTDHTTHIASELVAAYRKKGFNIHLIHRNNRNGYKAGALAAALKKATGDFIAIFDADFKLPADFLRRTIPYFLADPRLGLVQARWGHLNDTQSPFTAAQAIALDKHFALEQTVRYRANLFPRFNGTGGVWRRQCIEEAGGWLDDTVCEDLCLSIRAIKHNWRFLYLPDVVTPAELPPSILAFKSQQARWTKGTIQCLRKYGWTILSSREHSWLARFYALLSMTAYVTHLLVLILFLLQLPLIYYDFQFSRGMIIFSLIGLGQPLLFGLSQQLLYRDWRRRLMYLPLLLVVAIGTAVANTRAILEALTNQKNIFIRTPKQGNSPHPLPTSAHLDWGILVEISLTIYALLGILIAWNKNSFHATGILFTCGLGFGYTAWQSLREIHLNHQARQTTPIQSLGK